MTKEEILSCHTSQKQEMVGRAGWEAEAGEVTDDTEMTLCVARGIIASPQDPVEEIGRQFMSWYQTGKSQRYVGSTIRNGPRCLYRDRRLREGPGHHLGAGMGEKWPETAV